MFHLITIEDKVRIAPSQFNNEVQTIEDEIEKKYTSKVVLNAGLFVALYDILGTGDSYVHSGDGGAHLMVRFRMVVFKPFKGEVLEGVIKKSSRESIQISLGFFHEIYLNPIELPNPSNYNQEEGLWYWEWNENQLFFEDGGRVRFKIDQVEFNPEISQPAPSPKNVNTEAMDSYSLREYKEKQIENENLLKQVKSPLILKVSMREAGLGMVSWWTNQSGGDDDDDENEEDGEIQDGEVAEDDGGEEPTIEEDDE
ncbi:hypothetical protein ACTFIY_008984 [Dictyostelium cf. discoideum]